mgnify:CR=1 FL=1
MLREKYFLIQKEDGVSKEGRGPLGLLFVFYGST